MPIFFGSSGKRVPEWALTSGAASFAVKNQRVTKRERSGVKETRSSRRKSIRHIKNSALFAKTDATKPITCFYSWRKRAHEGNSKCTKETKFQFVYRIRKRFIRFALLRVLRDTFVIFRDRFRFSLWRVRICRMNLFFSRKMSSVMLIPPVIR